ncbi:proton-conducting transporter membrane subunit [uncultured Alistipes sp.]|jgi:formate hydrogenlyase subunit 3/multisubunit Na+/H+ antiporter MnhD subunit|uniref:proton-conducting transporter transmembrane domain-containing protein n=1 Tax=uncultured Alistipes sp. TaxID=538949 RepID=UPI0025F98200|nr:proton-conducting transporter membrane subunit [uncultured Alistipes sp.]
MFFLYTLFALAIITAAICIAPPKAKAWCALTFIVGAGAALSVKAVEALAGGRTVALWAARSLALGCDSGSLDPLSAFFVLLIAVGATAATLYSRGYLSHALERKSPAHLSLHYVALAVMSLSMLGVVVSDGGYSFLFFWELMTVASFLLILFDAERREVRRAALAYLIMMHIGFVLLVIGFVRLRLATGSASFAALTPYFADHAFLPLFLVFLAGFGMKAGLFPMHVWLPEAHPAAPSHVSALMSGVMIKTGVYGILRVVAALGTPEALRTAGLVILAAGIATGLWGVILAAAQNDMKRLLAYSSIENIGVIFIGIGIALLGKSSGNPSVTVCGIAGALLHTLNHSFFKSLLFFGAGNVLTQTGTTSLDSLGGAARHMPLTAILFLVGTAAICALPPFNGFVSELLIYSGMFKGIASGSDVLASAAGLAALALIGGIVVLAFAKLYGIVFLGTPRSHEVAEASEVDNFRLAAMALPLAGILFVGLFPVTAVTAITRAAGFFVRMPVSASDWLLAPTLTAVGRTAWLLIAVVAALAWLRHRTLRARKVAQGPTWGCSFTAPNIRMQYTGESFSEGLQSIMPSLTRQDGEGDAVVKSEIFPSAHRFDIRRKDRIGNLLSAWWVELLHQINLRVMRLRTGKINHYILFALAFLTLIFILSTLDLL